jgi:transcriptional regulator with XRE-family HTH domain
MTRGLRREEVAYLAGVSVTWYTWLEQGRDVTPSRQVVDSLARTLRLSHAEHVYLSALPGTARLNLPKTRVQAPSLLIFSGCSTPSRTTRRW